MTDADARTEISARPPDAPRLRWQVTGPGTERTTIAFTGRFDAVESMAVRARMAQPDITGAPHLVVDLQHVTFLDSAGLAVLVRARQDRLRTTGSIALVRPTSPEAMRVLHLTQFDQIFTLLEPRPHGGA